MPDGSQGKTVEPQKLDSTGKERLRNFVARIERLEADKAEVQADIKEVFAEAKGLGYDTKILRAVIRLRKMDPEDRAEQSALLDLYLDALGMGEGA